jgi:hypothetical protein
MAAARQFGGLSWVICSLLVLFGWCGWLAAAPYSGGDGTSNKPYLLSTPADLAALANTQADWGKCFTLTVDLDMQSTALAKPIGSKPAPFTGVFDGARHAIKGLVVNNTTGSSDPLGLFGVLGSPGLVERLRFIAPSVRSNGTAGIGVLAGLTIKGATVQQCSVEQATISASSSDLAGGLIGDNGGTVRECCAAGTINALGLAGGLLGRSTGVVENCAATASITTTKVGTGTAGGGLAGASIGCAFAFCLATSPNVTSQRPAGLVGYADANTVFNKCVCNKVAPKAVENWAADAPGFAWCEDPNNLKASTYFTTLGWDLKTVWVMDASGVLRLRWMNTGPTAAIRELSGTILADPATKLAKVALDGTASGDPDGGSLRYKWQCLTADGGPTSILIDSVANPSVTLPVGEYKIQLTVSNGLVDSTPVSMTITVALAAVNGQPTAFIKGPTDVVRADPATGLARITLDGSQSSDPDKDSLKYNWQCLTSDGVPTGITIDAVVTPSLSLRPGVYRIELRVNDGQADSAPSSFTVTVAAPNTAPTAVARGPSGPVRPDATTGLAKIALDGSQSTDPEKDALTYTWRCLTAAGSPLGIAVDPVCNPTLSLRAGQYRIELTVSDGTTASTPSAVSVTVNTQPTAEAGGPVQVSDDGTGKCEVKLDGSKSFDPEAGKGQTLVYSWTCSTANPGTASGPTPSLVFPVGVHTVTLTVNDGVESSGDTTQVTVSPGVPAMKVAASPSTIGLAGTVPDVKFYLLLPTGKGVADVDTQAPIYLDSSGATISLTRDEAYSHKTRTVVAGTDRQKLLGLVGTAVGSRSVKVRVRLKTGETAFASLSLNITAGSGPSQSQVNADRAYYYLDTKTWK